jgi:hypothetical protein
MGDVLDRTGLSTGLESLRAATGPAADQAGRPTTAATDQFRQHPSSTPRQVGTTGDRTARDATSTFGIPNWACWALPLIMLGGLLWYLFANPPQQEQVAQRPAPPAQSQSVVVDGVDVKNTLGDSLGDLRTSLQSVTDVESAKAALPKLEAASQNSD